MLTYQMIGLADQNGRKYECEYGTYSQEDGFMFNENIDAVIADKGWRGLIDILFHKDMWKLAKDEPKKMTLKDIEKELGYRVKIVDPEPDKPEVSSAKKKETNDVVDMFNRLFGINLRDE